MLLKQPFNRPLFLCHIFHWVKMCFSVQGFAEGF